MLVTYAFCFYVGGAPLSRAGTLGAVLDTDTPYVRVGGAPLSRADAFRPVFLTDRHPCVNTFINYRTPHFNQ